MHKSGNAHGDTDLISTTMPAETLLGATSAPYRSAL